MEMYLSILIIAAAVFSGYSLKKFYDKPYIVNFSLAVMLLLIVLLTLLMEPITRLGYAAIIICSLAFIVQLVLGVKNIRSKDQVKA